jgi:hypothetical protein
MHLVSVLQGARALAGGGVGVLREVCGSLQPQDTGYALGVRGGTSLGTKGVPHSLGYAPGVARGFRPKQRGCPGTSWGQSSCVLLSCHVVCLCACCVRARARVCICVPVVCMLVCGTCLSAVSQAITCA